LLNGRAAAPCRCGGGPTNGWKVRMRYQNGKLVCAFVALMALELGATGCRRSSQPADAPTPAAAGSGAAAAAEGSAGEEGSAAAAAPAAIPADSAAVVDGMSVMTRAEIDEQLAEIVSRYERLPDREPTTARWRNERRRRLVQAAVHDHVVAQFVARENPPVEEAALLGFVRREIGEVHEDERLFERFLQSRNQTREQYMAERRAELARELVLARRGALEPTDTEIQEFYNRNVDRWRAEERARVSVITVRVRANATPEQEAEARQRIDALRARVTTDGEDFAEVARTSSESADRVRGGDLGWIVRGRRPELAQAGVEDLLFRAPVGQVTEPQRTQLGLQIFLVHDRRPAGVRQLDEVRDTIYEPLRRRRIDRLRMELVEELLRTASVEYRESNWGLEPEEGEGSGAR
jgi:parvulin-like peptidyl-prolyl isomerase